MSAPPSFPAVAAGRPDRRTDHECDQPVCIVINCARSSCLSTWRQAGSDTAELVLRSVGIDRNEAIDIATAGIDALPRMAVFDAA